MTDWVTVQGSQADQPAEIDLASSPSTVYQRRNVTQVDKALDDGTTVKEWLYEERTMTPQEYMAYLQKNNADLQDAVTELAGIVGGA